MQLLTHSPPHPKGRGGELESNVKLRGSDKNNLITETEQK